MKATDNRTTDGFLCRFARLFTESLGWLRIAASPAIIGLVAAALIYFPAPSDTRLVVAFIVAGLGIFAGIVWATRIWKKRGTVDFLARVMATPELDKPETSGSDTGS